MLPQRYAELAKFVNPEEDTTDYEPVISYFKGRFEFVARLDVFL